MGIVMGNADFVKYRRKTRPVVAVPRNVREAVPVSKIYEDGIFAIEPEEGRWLFDRAYIFGDINYTLKDDAEKEAVLLTLCKIFNSINVDFKIIISNAGRDMEAFYEDIFFPETGKYGELGRHSNAWIRDGLKRGKPEICQIRYLILTVRKKTYEEAKAFFNGLDALLDPLFGSIKSSILPLDAEERLRILHGTYRLGRESKYHWTWEEMQRTTRNWKNEICPSSIDSFKDYLVIDHKYISVLFAFTLPNSIDESKAVAELSNLPYPSMVTLDYAPIPRAVIRSKLMTAGVNNERAIHAEQERRRKAQNYVSGVSYGKQKRKEEIEAYLEQLDDNDENGYFFSLLVTIQADSVEELRSRMESVRVIGEGLGGIEFVPYNHRQLKAFHTALPLGTREVDCMRTMFTSSLAAFQPFFSKDILDPGSQFYGVNRTTQNMIMMNRKKLKNGNGLISGHPGGGKSMFLKLVEIIQTMTGSEDDVFIIDPQNEFQKVVQALGGQFFDLSAKSGIYLNFFEVPDEVFLSEDPSARDVFVADQVSFAEAFCYAVMKGIYPTGIHKSIITACVMKMYNRVFADPKMRQPLLTDFYDLLVEYGKENPRDEQEAREIHKSLEAYCRGTFDMFAHPSNLDIHNRLVAFGMKNISSEIWEPVMLVVMHLLSQRINYNQKYQKATHFLVDEGQYICQKESSAEQLEKAFLTYRKFGGICTLVVQNMSAVLGNPKIKSLADDCEFKCFFDQGGVDRQEISEIISLSSAEYEALNEDIPGHCVILWGKDVLLCDCRISEQNPLFELCNTSFHREKQRDE